MAITRLTAIYRVTTPLFSSGFEGSQAEIRASSIGGALRFWFRALAWHAHQNVATVRNAEDELFGSTRTGQAKVLLSLRPLGKPQELPVGEPLDWGRAYLAGQGLGRPLGGKWYTRRPALREGTRFEVHLLLRSVTAVQIEQVCECLLALGLFGGLGARSRRGFGSLSLESLENPLGAWKAPLDLKSLDQQISMLLQPRRTKGAGEPPYTAFWEKTRVLLLPAPPNSIALQERLGRAFLHFRGWGRKGIIVGGQKALGIFGADHDELEKVAQDSIPAGVTQIPAPLRAVFGLPHNYFFSGAKQKVNVNAETNQRRASPLWFHVHQADSKSAQIAVVTFFPGVFLPNPALKIERQEGRRRYSAMLPSVNFWKPVEDFLAELQASSKSKLCEKFKETKEV